MEPFDEGAADDLLRTHFANHRAETLATVRPPGALAARRASQARRRRRLLSLAAATAAALAASIGGYAVSRPATDPTGVSSPPDATSAPSASGRAAPAGEQGLSNGPLSGPSGGPVPPGTRLISVTFISTASAWALGYAPCLSPHPWSECPVVLRSRDGGRAWVGAPAPGDAAYDGDIRFADSKNGWIVARGPLVAKDPGGAPSTVYATHDGGASWHRIGVQSARRVETAGGRVWLTAGSSAAPLRSVYSAPIDSDTFVKVTESVGAELVLHGRYAYVYGGGAAEFTAIKDGVVASRPSLPCPTDSPVNVVLAASGNLALAAVCAVAGGTGTQPKLAYTSTDGGATWTPAGTPDPGGSIGSLAATGSAVFLTGQEMPIRVTRDSGRTWAVALASPGPEGFGYVGFTDDTHGVALAFGSSSAVYLTTDAGRTWIARQPG